MHNTIKIVPKNKHFSMTDCQNGLGSTDFISYNLVKCVSNVQHIERPLIFGLMELVPYLVSDEFTIDQETYPDLGLVTNLP